MDPTLGLYSLHHRSIFNPGLGDLLFGSSQGSGLVGHAIPNPQQVLLGLETTIEPREQRTGERATKLKHQYGI